MARTGTVEERIIAVVVEQLSVEEAQATPDASFIDDLAADSLDIVEVVMALEEEFEIEIPDGDAEDIGTVAEAIAYVKKRLAENAS